MPIEIKKLPKSEVEITGEMPAEEFSGYWQKAVNEFSKEASIPGFRPGKVPEKVIVEKVGEGNILEKSAELAIKNIYPKIVAEKKLDVIGPPTANITKLAKGSPLGFKFVAAVLPEIGLAENYKEVAKKVFDKKEKILVEDKEIDESIEYLRKMRVSRQSSEQAEEGKESELPELNDEFAKSVGKFETLVELRETISKNIQLEKEEKEKEKKRLEALDAILKVSNLEVPEILVDAEKNKMLSELKANITSMGMKWEEYLAQVKKTEEEILKGWSDGALRRVSYGLLLKKLDEDLKPEIADKEIEEMAGKINPHSENVDKNRLKDYAYGIVRNEKIFKILEDNQP